MCRCRVAGYEDEGAMFYSSEGPSLPFWFGNKTIDMETRCRNLVGKYNCSTDEYLR